MLTEFEQKIYNCYLATSRSCLNKPFTLRKDFSDFTEKDYNYIFIKKLALFFDKFPQIDMGTFFRAPFEIYNDGELYDLKFFSTQKAIAVYSSFVKRLQEQSPESPEQLKKIKESLSFVIKYCVEKNIPITGYINYKSPGSTTEDYLSHFKLNKVCLYVLLKLPNFEKNVYSLDEELRSLFFGDALDKISSLKIKLYQSKKANQLIDNTLKQAIQILH